MNEMVIEETMQEMKEMIKGKEAVLLKALKEMRKELKTMDKENAKRVLKLNKSAIKFVEGNETELTRYEKFYISIFMFDRGM
jgi:hypothetical protein